MLTRIEIDGFKTFRNLAIDLAPFQVIVGPGGAGKSNLFDALALLANLAEGDLRAAFQEARGEPRELFSMLPDGARAGRMRLAAEMLVEPDVRDDWGSQADVRYTRMRYEIEIARGAGDDQRPERPRVVHEALYPIQRSTDPWARRFIGKGRELWLPVLRTGRTVPFISTDAGNGISTVYLHQDGHGGDMAAAAQGAERTVLSTIANTEFPHAFAAREEMRGWRRIELEPSAIRNDGQSLPHSFIAPDGGNLAAALLRMKGEDGDVLRRIAADLARLAPWVAGVEVDERGPWGEPRIIIRRRDDGTHSLPLLSGSMLRMLALSALKNDPDAGGIICLEEPENGLDGPALVTVVRVLLSMCTSLDSEEKARLRQVIIATHSMTVVREAVAQLTAGREGPFAELPEVLFAFPGSEDGEPSSFSNAATRLARVTPSLQLTLGFGSEEEESCYTLAEVEQALGE